MTDRGAAAAAAAAGGLSSRRHYYIVPLSVHCLFYPTSKHYEHNNIRGSPRQFYSNFLFLRKK